MARRGEAHADIGVESNKAFQHETSTAADLSLSFQTAGGREINFPTTNSSDDDEGDGSRITSSKPDYLSDASFSGAGNRDQLLDDENVVTRFRRQCGEAVNHPRVQLTIVFLIAVNALLMGIGTFEFIKEYPNRERAFEITDTVFLTIFTVELFFQFVYRGVVLLTDGWLVFDLVIIVTSWAFAELQIIRAFRIFRALRLITRVPVMQNLIIALFGVMPRMFAIGLLLFLVSYIFAVMFTQLFKDLYEKGQTDADYFGRLDKTFYTLFQIMTFDGWPDIARQVMKVYAWAWLPFVTFVIITSFVVVNLIIAVICDAISALHDDDKAKLHGQQTSLDTTTANNHDMKTLRESLTLLERNVENLTKTQDETLQAISALVEHLQANHVEE